MKNFLLIVIFACSSIVCMAQSAKNELENGYKVGPQEKLFLQFSEDGNMKISVDKIFSNPLTHKDSTLFLTKNVGVNVYMRPINPLKATTKQSQSIINDPATEAAEEALSSILNLLQSILETSGQKESSEEGATEELLGKIADSLITDKTINDEQKELIKKMAHKLDSLSGVVRSNAEFLRGFKEDAEFLKKKLDEINEEIKKKRQQEVKELFKELKELDFKNKKQTLDSLSEIEKKLKLLKKHYSEIEKKINAIRESPNKPMLLINYITGLVLNEIEAVKNGQFEKVKAFEKLFEMVKNYAQQADLGVDGVEWVIPLGEISPGKGKISTLSVELFSGKYSYDEENNAINEVSPSSIRKHSIRVKRFNRFVPEVVLGTVFTFIEYPVYGTSVDENGNQIVEKSGNEEINNLKISGMINLNYFISNSWINPLLQIGLGINNEIPTLLAGGGGRIHINNTRFAISGGIAFTWVKDLSDLSEGDSVSGTADIEEDLTYQFKWPPSPYFGLQFKF